MNSEIDMKLKRKKELVNELTIYSNVRNDREL